MLARSRLIPEKKILSHSVKIARVGIALSTHALLICQRTEHGGIALPVPARIQFLAPIVPVSRNMLTPRDGTDFGARRSEVMGMLYVVSRRSIVFPNRSKRAVGLLYQHSLVLH